MRRFLLLLLAFMLTLQTSWAAAHFCDDEGLVSQAVAAGTLPSDHVHSATLDELSEQQGDQIADACCEAAHGCHGLHHLVGQSAPEFASVSLTYLPALFRTAPPIGALRCRIERPNWLAA